MSSTIIIVGIVVISISISIVGVVMYNSSASSTEPSSTQLPSTQLPSTQLPSTQLPSTQLPSTPTRTYTKSVNMDLSGSDIKCYEDGSSADFCKAKCDSDTTCKAYNYIHKNTAWGQNSGCCYKTFNQPLGSSPGIDFYALN